MDDQKSIKRSDYNSKTNDVVPISDPNMVSNTQMMLKAEILKGFMGMGLDDNKIIAKCLEATAIPDWEDLIPEEPQEPEPDPKTVVRMMEIELDRERVEMEKFKLQFEVLKLHADAMKSIAQAEAAEEGPHVKMYEATLKAMTEQHKAMEQKKEGVKKDAKAKSK
jgi:hypothetical protein